MVVIWWKILMVNSLYIIEININADDVICCNLRNNNSGSSLIC